MRTPHTPAHGFTLVELMVGMALALITTVIIAQVVVNAEGQRRTTSSGSDAQVNGSVGLYTVSRDVQGAGYGLISHSAALGCPITAKYGSAATLALTLAPVTITVNANGVPTLRTFSSGRSSFSVPMVVKANHAAVDTSFTVNSSTGVSNGDTMMAIPGTWSSTNWCTVFQVAGSGANVLSSTVVPNVTVTAGWNPASTASLMPTTGYPADTSYLVNLGSIVLREYTVASENLVMRELQATGTWGADQVLASGIVAMRVMYGKDTSAPKDGVVDQFDTTTPTTADDWSRVLSVRIAVVARSEVREKDAVTTTDPVWDVGTATTVSGTAACSTGSSRQCLTLTIPKPNATDTEWQHYRYKVYDTVVPLRNVVWSAV
ncbi:PilW family protein [Aquabacterium sp.]|uniref:PilW family protein n=1 Tax=Aquabacterium sp. TaxID=1872578 RepID=UPI002488A988|nr:PilW family protein [Aquabacterium sp.]MDI1349238.1 PilW family protein [Aquabacterium sp.]